MVIALEPLNRYENHMINTLDQARVLCETIGSRHLGIAADTYHMNIEEADPLKAFLDSAAWLRHVQLSDSNRLEPGRRSPRLDRDPAGDLGRRLRCRARVRVPALRRRRRRPAHLGAPDPAGRLVMSVLLPDRRRPSGSFDAPLARAAIAVLGRNWHGHSTVPSRGLYPHQWSWDSAFIALGLRHWAPRRAATELLSLFGAQWADGRVPHIVFNPAVHDDAYFPGPVLLAVRRRGRASAGGHLRHHPAAGPRGRGGGA